MRFRSIVCAAIIAGAVPAFAQPPAAGTPRGRSGTPSPAQAPRGDAQPAAPVARTPAPAPAEAPAAPRARREGQPVNIKIRLGFNLQYDWPAPLEGPPNNPSQQPPRGAVIKTALHDSVTLILESGKSMIAAQSADPIGDRQVTVEVKATV